MTDSTKPEAPNSAITPPDSSPDDSLVPAVPAPPLGEEQPGGEIAGTPGGISGSGPVAKLLRYSIPAICALLAAAIYLILVHEQKLAGVGSSVGFSGEPVAVGGDYYVTVSLIEITPTDRDGGSWESLGSTGPDPYVEIWWQGSAVYKSSVKEDTLIASWSDTELSLRDMALLGKKVSVDDVRKGARVNVRSGETIVFKVYDEDNLSDTLVGEHSLSVTELRIGDQIITPRESAIRRMVIRTLPLKGE